MQYSAVVDVLDGRGELYKPVDDERLIKFPSSLLPQLYLSIKITSLCVGGGGDVCELNASI